MTYEEIKRKHNLTDEKIGKMFGYKNKMSFSNATRKDLITKGVEELYQIFTDTEQLRSTHKKN